MKLKYFSSNIRTLEELKKEYKKLAKMYHPDITGRDTNAEMSQINAEYEELFEMVKNVKFNHQDKTFYESKEETTEKANDFINIINILIKVANIEIVICGSWLWVSGKTYPIKETLKENNFNYSKNKNAWYLHFDNFKKKSRKSLSLDEIKEYFGSEYYQNEKNQFLLA